MQLAGSKATLASCLAPSQHRVYAHPTHPASRPLPAQVYALAVLPQLLPTLHTWSEVGLLCCASAARMRNAGGSLAAVLHRSQVGTCTKGKPLTTPTHLLPCRRGPQVSGKVLGGADLFLQGVLAPPGGLPDFLAGSPRSLSVPGNPCPFAGGARQPEGSLSAWS